MTEARTAPSRAELDAAIGTRIAEFCGRHSNMYQVLQRGEVNAVIGTVYAGSSAGQIKKHRRRLRDALRGLGIEPVSASG